MIFKYCVWMEPGKDEANGKSQLVNGTNNGSTTPSVILKPLSGGGRKFAEGLLGCCPCAFRCRRAIGVDAQDNGPILANGRTREDESTPVIALRMNGSSDTIDKEIAEQETDDSNPDLRPDSGHTHSQSGSTNLSDRASSPRHDPDDARSNSGSSSSSNRSATPNSSNRTRRSIRPTLPAHTESDESNNRQATDEQNSRASSPESRLADKAFDVISAKSRRDTPDVVSIRTEIEELNNTSSSDEPNAPTQNQQQQLQEQTPSESSSVDSLDRHRARSARSAESLLSDGSGKDADLPGYSGFVDGAPTKSRPCSRSSSSEKAYSARGSSPARSMTNLDETNDDVDGREASESPEDEEEVAFENLDFRNARDVQSASSMVLGSPVKSRASYEYDNEVRNSDSNITLYSCTSVVSPKAASPRRFVTDQPAVVPKDSPEDSDEAAPYELGYENGEPADESSDEQGSDETDDVKPQPSRVPTPIDLPRRLFKMSPCKMRPQTNCNRSGSQPGQRHCDKHVEKVSKATQQCFTHLDSKDWEVTLKGLRTLSQIARDEPEQLDACAPGLLARVLGKHVKNLRSQVARVACSAAGEVFSAHIRGIDQDLDEIAGPLLHRTADTNRFLREDCNAALDVMIEHFPPHRTVMTIANRGASHQNTIVHATTARLLYLIVSDIGPDNAMHLPREVKDKLFATTAKLLTDGNLQARKHAKETFRLLSRCEGFRKALTDAVPESTLRLIDKTLRTL